MAWVAALGSTGKRCEFVEGPGTAGAAEVDTACSGAVEVGTACSGSAGRSEAVLRKTRSKIDLKRIR